MIRKPIGKVANIGKVQHGYAPVEALWPGRGQIDGSAGLFDRPIPRCVELSANPNGTITATLHGKVAEEVATGGGTLDAGNGRTIPEYSARLQRIVASFGSEPRRLEFMARFRGLS